jgi:hypothetical protein
MPSYLRSVVFRHSRKLSTVASYPLESGHLALRDEQSFKHLTINERKKKEKGPPPRFSNLDRKKIDSHLCHAIKSRLKNAGTKIGGVEKSLTKR